MTNLQVAKIAHEIRATYLALINGKDIYTWDSLPQLVKDYVLGEVHYWVKNPSAKASDSHNNWFQLKTEDGWSYGESIDIENKKHPEIIPYEKKPIEQKIANELFMNTVKSLSEFIEN